MKELESQAMESAKQLVAGVGSLNVRQLRLVADATALDEDERQILEAVVTELPERLRPVVRKVLCSWDEMSVPERTASLLMMAEALRGC